ncbi:MAG: Omp28-related outer membrane protein, partial [Flavobacteriales bacterium]|nr:Omp28-related outer membrane protein [Flavobacteriales bacterium]
LDITVELFYTSDSPGGNDYIHVLVKEDHLTGWQTDYGNGNQPNYDHTEVMRAYATPVWGDEVTTTTAGSSVTRTYSLAVNAAWTLANLEVVAFVGEYQGQVYQAREVMADGGTTLVVGELTSTAGSAFQSGSPGSGLSLGNDLTNLLGADEDYEVSLASADAPGDWTGTFSVGGMSYNAPATINITDGSTEAITVDITPGNTVGIATYTLTVASTSNNNAPVLVQEY